MPLGILIKNFLALQQIRSCFVGIHSHFSHSQNSVEPGHSEMKKKKLHKLQNGEIRNYSSMSQRTLHNNLIGSPSSFLVPFSMSGSYSVFLTAIAPEGRTGSSLKKDNVYFGNILSQPKSISMLPIRVQLINLV